jgi:hypothetical protein
MSKSIGVCELCGELAECNDRPSRLLPRITEKFEPLLEPTNSNPSTHDCIIAVDENGVCILLKSEPSLYQHELFDGNSLHDNIDKHEDRIPKEFGVYKCKILVQGTQSFGGDAEVEYDVHAWIEDVKKLFITEYVQVF